MIVFILIISYYEVPISLLDGLSKETLDTLRRQRDNVLIREEVRYVIFQCQLIQYIIRIVMSVLNV
jgi:hypothetical protein